DRGSGRNRPQHQPCQHNQAAVSPQPEWATGSADLEKTERWFAKHGTKAVFFGRMIPIFRSLISVPAGLERMPLPIFLTLTALGSFIWNSCLIMAGYALGAQWGLVEQYVGVLSKVVLGLGVLGLGLFITRKVRSRRVPPVTASSGPRKQDG
ncbi:DedA family protein, partial [Streptomyces erythrochromogenes]|uniref:DedA family protein n=1 Tax=Streptomyces erythrochromogenes TaxID=285574 RepID=UPI00342AEB30